MTPPEGCVNICVSPENGGRRAPGPGSILTTEEKNEFLQAIPQLSA